ncbi:DUF2721 domain-containing protein [Xylophilus sp. ASV27]|uniref:DUF2721 domain-containing protein n=1 Tax=Xylophilus sp. ASV27 TaxID=2795129 RepID=UPI0018EBBC9D|nr:DUF2721 domain-containing protein [Xylophilus sp. ASV27]
MLSIHADTSHVIQLAVGPAFMLAAIGSTLTILTNRLARVNDRTHKRREDRATADASKHAEIDDELHTLNRRAKVINAAMSSGSACAIIVCLMIASLFLANELGIAFDRPVAVLFVTAMAALITTYGLMLIEIFIAQRSINPT